MGEEYMGIAKAIELLEYIKKHKDMNYEEMAALDKAFEALQCLKDVGIKAFQDSKYDYYELTQPLGYGGNNYLLPDGAIFVHDTDDRFRGSISNGCLKLCWTPDGSTYGGLCGNTVVFHASFKDTDMFRRVDNDKINKLNTLISNLEEQLSKAKDELKKISST